MSKDRRPHGADIASCMAVALLLLLLAWATLVVVLIGLVRP